MSIAFGECQIGRQSAAEVSPGTEGSDARTSVPTGGATGAPGGRWTADD